MSACQVEEAAEMGLRSQRGGVGAQASLRQQEDPQAQEAQEVRRKPSRRRADYKIMDGDKYKLCTGPLHRSGRYVRVHDGFYTRTYKGKKQPRPECKECEAFRSGSERMVPLSRVRFALEELVNRVGKAEAGRQIGIPQQHVWKLINGHTRRVQRKTAARILVALKRARDANLLRHRDSILHGASMRGRPEKTVTRRKDLYQPESPEQIEERRTAARERKREKRAKT